MIARIYSVLAALCLTIALLQLNAGIASAQTTTTSDACESQTPPNCDAGSSNCPENESCQTADRNGGCGCKSNIG